MEKTKITIETNINAPIEKVWTYWTVPEHITNWYFASPEWHAPRAENDLRSDGRFLTRMEAKDGSFGFDFSGTYTMVKLHETIAYTLDDDRTVHVAFEATGNFTKLTQIFEAEDTHPIEMQKGGWQAILNNFKTYTENH